MCVFHPPLPLEPFPIPREEARDVRAITRRPDVPPEDHPLRERPQHAEHFAPRVALPHRSVLGHLRSPGSEEALPLGRGKDVLDVVQNRDRPHYVTIRPARDGAHVRPEAPQMVGKRAHGRVGVEPGPPAVRIQHGEHERVL